MTRLFLTPTELNFEHHDKTKHDTTGSINIAFNDDGSCTFECDSGNHRTTRDGRDDAPEDARFTIPAEHTDDFFAALEELIEARQALAKAAA